jgi:siroheme synthase
LKGGDPFVFGRGGEEAEALAAAGIVWEVIPGVSSGIAAAAYAGIPLTHRDYASSVAFITGHEAEGKLSFDSCRASNADTVVVFMCGATIARIARGLIEAGRSSSTAIAIVRFGTYRHQELYIGTLGEIALDDASIELRVKPPAIAIVGDVVLLRKKLNWFGSHAHSVRELREETGVSIACHRL